MTLREAAKQALAALQTLNRESFVTADCEGVLTDAIAALRAALAEQAMLQAVTHVRYAEATEVTEDQRRAIPYELFKTGDCRLVWANEGDLLLRGKLFR